MSILQDIVLGIVQGLTEFLPISSSAHLILVPRVFGWPDQGLHFDIAANTGTLLAVVVYFRRELLILARGVFGALSPAALGAIARGDASANPQARLAWGLLLGTIPAGLAGLALHDWVASDARNATLIGVEMIVFGLVLWAADRLAARRAVAGAAPQELAREVGIGDALVVGCAQALALLPGTSRSGITMSAGIFRGLDRATAARYSFLLSVPIGVMVGAKDTWDLLRGAPLGGSVGEMLVVMAVSALTGLAVIHFLLAWLRRRSLLVFVGYRLVLGTVLLLTIGA